MKKLKSEKKLSAKQEIDADSARFFCVKHTVPKPASFSVAWLDGTATLRCPSCGLSTLDATNFAAQRKGLRE